MNKSPSVRPFRYFTDPKVLDRVPLMFLLLGGVSLAMEIFALCILREPTEEEVVEIKVSFVQFRVTLVFSIEYVCRIFFLVLILLQSWNVILDKSPTDGKVTHSVSTKEAVTGGLFWAKWGTLLCVGLLMSFLGSYQKTYGQG